MTGDGRTIIENSSVVIENEYIAEIQKIKYIPFDTADRILNAKILATPKFGSFNIHLSLLPSYKGLTPTKQTLLHGESQTGVSLYKIKHSFDTSHVITQQPLDIDDFFDDGLLRQRLAGLQYPMLTDLFEFLESPEGYPKTMPGLPESSYFKPFHEIKVELNPKTSILQLSRQLRASSPFPGLRLKFKDKYYELKKFLEYSQGKYEFNFKESGYISIYGHDGVLHCVGNSF